MAVLCDELPYNLCNMGIKDLPDMYVQSSRAAGMTAEGIHIGQIMSANVTTNMSLW